ncbi:MAG: NTP transferase domain-containing protein [Parcubacteria group bacterium]|nr:NTP transferase domain-containing protein [Parcubacteria group bacterium]
MINKIVISAAGRGTRMGDLTKDIPKPLLEVKGRPFLYYLLENIKKAGFTEIIVVTGYKSEKVEEFLNKYDSNVQTVNQFEKLGEEKYGTACSIMSAEDLVGSESLISVYGDNLYSVKDLSKLRESNDDFCYVSGIEDKHPENYGVLISKNNFLVKIIERPREFYTNLINIGFYKFTSEIFKIVEKVGKSERGEYELTDAVTYLAKQKKVKINIIKDYWKDFGKPEDIKNLEEFIEKEYNL